MALHEAARVGQLQRVKQLLAQGAAANEADGQGRTPLYVTAGRGHHAVVQLLLAAQGTNVSAKAAGVWDWNPLHAAAEKGHSEVVQLLLAAGAKVDAADTHGRTPLHAAALYRHHKVVQLLLAAGAKVNADERGWTPLHYAAEEGPSKNCREVVQALLAARANVNAADSDGWTP
jgi:ankyrin repeat protein